MPKVISNDVKEVVLKVRSFFLDEKEFKAPLIPLNKVNDRVSEATGLSVRSIQRIIIEDNMKRQAKASGIVLPIKRRKIREKKLMDDVASGALRRIIHEFGVRKEIPTLKKLHLALKEDIGFKGSLEIVRQYMVKNGIKTPGKPPIRKKVTQKPNDTKQPTKTINNVQKLHDDYQNITHMQPFEFVNAQT